LMRVAEEFGFRIHVFQHVLEGYRVADEMAEHGAHASTFSDWWAYKMEAYEAIPHNAAIMTQRGVNVSINSDSGEEGRHLNQEAAKTMKWGGLSEAEALATVTINPAFQLLIDDRVGSLEAGKDADIVLWENYPLSSYARVRTTYIDGEVVFDVDADMAMRVEIAAEKAELREMLGEADEGDDSDNEREPGRQPGGER
ncbi:MAG: amidohydrolase family protein, partial [Gemmatimonadales bacterium]|nr:amidohydrolase family protein [Gemmatimonadales bacterium]